MAAIFKGRFEYILLRFGAIFAEVCYGSNWEWVSIGSGDNAITRSNIMKCQPFDEDLGVLNTVGWVCKQNCLWLTAFY